MRLPLTRLQIVHFSGMSFSNIGCGSVGGNQGSQEASNPRIAGLDPRKSSFSSGEKSIATQRTIQNRKIVFPLLQHSTTQ